MQWSKFMYSLQTGWREGYAAARRVYEDPSGAYREDVFRQYCAHYDLLWSYYNNGLFDRVNGKLHGLGERYRSNYNLYRNIDLLYNPARRLADFYASQIYPGVLSEDGSRLPDGVPLAIPFSEDTPPILKTAIAQWWAWTNWQARMQVFLTYGVALGSVLVEIVDDLPHGKVTVDIPWPGNIIDLELDAAGNVKAYCLEYQARDSEGVYTYKKEVDGAEFRYYRNGELYDYGHGAVIPNPYGFIPAVWVKHLDSGGIHGSPAIAGSLAPIDKLNNLVSHINDQIHKVIGAPMVVWSSGVLKGLFEQEKRGPSNDFEEKNRSIQQEGILMLKGNDGGSVDSLAGNLDLAGADIFVGRLVSEIEKRHPELTFYEQLRVMSQVTGPAAQRLVGDVSGRLLKAQATYDSASISLFQMAVAIGGYRANSGTWGKALTRQQQKFLPFDLTSYESGGLDMAIMPRPLLTPTKTEQAQEKQAFWTAAATAKNAGVPIEIFLKMEGWTPEQINELTALKKQQQEESLAMMQQQAAISGGNEEGREE